LERLNGRFEIRKHLSSPAGVEQYLCSDVLAEGRPCVVTVREGRPGDGLAVFARLRDLFCPSLVQPELFEVVRGGAAPSWLTSRQFLAGSSGESGALPADAAAQLSETFMYLDFQDYRIPGIDPASILLTEDAEPLLYVLDLPPAGDPASGDRKAAIPRSGYRPLVTRDSAIPSRMLGYSGIPGLVADSILAQASTGCSPVAVLSGGQPLQTASLVRDVAARLQVSGWRMIELRSGADRSLFESLLERLVALGILDGPPDLSRLPDELLDGGPVLLEVRIRSSRLEDLRSLAGVVEASAGRAGLLVRTDGGREVPGAFASHPFEIDLESLKPSPNMEILQTFLASKEIPEGLLQALERYEAVGPADVLSMLRFLSARQVLQRSGPSWAFSASRERALSTQGGAGSVSLSAVVGLDDTDKGVLALLSHLGSAISLAAMTEVLQEAHGILSSSLEKLTSAGLLSKVEERGFTGWKPAGQVPEEFLTPPGNEAIWSESFLGFVLGSPAAALPELLAAARLAVNEPFALANILYSALLLARETGGLDLLSDLAGQIAGLPPDSLSPTQMRSILMAVEPCRLPRLNAKLLKPLLEYWLDGFTDPLDTVLAKTRLGELQFVERAHEESYSLLSAALGLIAATPGGITDLTPSVISSALRAASALGKVDDLASIVGPFPSLLAPDARPETTIGVLSWVAVIQAQAGFSQEALALIQKAAPFLPLAGPAGRQTYDWCHGRTLMVFGELSAAAASLERALLLAENRADHLSVAEILSSLVLCQERLPGHTVRRMIENLNLVADRAAAAGNASYRAFALSRLIGLYVRSLQYARAGTLFAELESLGRDPLSEEASYASWYKAIMDFQVGSPPSMGAADVYLPGTAELMDCLTTGRDPAEAVSKVSSFIRTSARGELVPAGLYLALEAAARGFDTPARIIASALAELYRPHMDEVIPAWRLCINGLLSARPAETEKALWSAQHVARQLDRLMLVWMILRVRLRIDPGDDPRKTASIAVLLEELDRHIEGQLPSAARARFAKQPEIVRRREGFAALCPPGCPLDRLRDAIEESVKGSPAGMPNLGAAREELTMRSDISWGLEMLNSFSEASRVSILACEDGKYTMTESRGFGAGLPPSPEMLEAVASCGGRHFLVENFGRTPFGSRFLHAVPLGRSHLPIHSAERRKAQEPGTDGYYLIVEVDSPFNTLAAGRESILMCFARQISTSIALRDLEIQTQHDSLTGAKIAGVWLARLREVLGGSSVSRDRPLAVLMMDLDFFKSVNDSFGHREGDRVLRTFVDAVISTVRPNDVVGRLGGEEFGVILFGASEKNAATVAERIRLKVASSVLRPDRRPVTVSIGISVAPVHGEATELLIARADVALYESKRKGRDRCTMWSSAMASTFSEQTADSLLNTGDPGWDQNIAQTVFRLLGPAELDLQHLADEIRNALRCEYFLLKPPTGDMVSLGLAEASRGFRDLAAGPPGKPDDAMSPDKMYYGAAMEMYGGGSLLATWRAGDISPRVTKGLMAAFGSLASLILGKRAASEGEP
jgi:diguanylate cyclase (GGDEF)-like protein